MATIRMALSAGAALIALTAIVPAASHAQAPLQLVPGPNQAKKPTGVGTTRTAAAKKAAKTPGNGTGTAASRQSPRQNAATAQAMPNKKPARQTASAAQPSSNTSIRTHARKTANSIARRREGQTTTNAQRARVVTSPRAARVAAAAASPIPSSPAPEPQIPEPQIFAQGSGDRSPADNIMRGSDSISLIALLPWWRNDRMQDVSYGSEEAESKVMAAADAWFAAHGSEAVWDDTSRDTAALASPDDGTGTVDIVDAGELNEIDLAAASAPPEPSFLQSLIALLGGVVAAAAASARLLFV